MPFRIASPSLAAVADRFSADPQVISAVRTASTETGTRFETLLASAALESGLKPTAQARNSSASGLFQFTEQTWLDAVRQFGASHGMQAEAAAVVQSGGRLTVANPALKEKILDMRNDPKTSATLAGDHLRGVVDRLSATLGRVPDAAEAYLGHFLGSGGAGQMLQAVQSTPQRAAADLLPEAARANPAMFYGADGKPYSAAQFVQHVRDRVGKAYADLGAAMPQAGSNPVGGAILGHTADPSPSGASGLGTSTPRRAATPPERLMLASLAEVFTRVDRGVASAEVSRSRHERKLPTGIVSALAAASGQAPNATDAGGAPAGV